MTRVGLIGTRGHFNEVLDGIPVVDDCVLAGVAPGDDEDNVARLSEHAAWSESTVVYDDYGAMLDAARLDVVCVCMPYYRNAGAAIASAAAGVDVICEKPVATTLEDLARLKAAVADNGVQLSALFAMRTSPAILAVREAVASGRIGRPILAFGQKSYRWGTRPEFFRQRETYGGSIPWVAIHAIDFVRFCSGLEYASVRGLHGNLAHDDYPGCEDCGGLLFEFVGGGQAVITFDYLRPAAAPSHGDDRLRIAGSAGVVEVRLADGCAELIGGDGVETLTMPEGKQLFVDYMKARRGGGEPVIGPDEAIRVTEIALKAREAADTGQVIEL